MENALLFNLLIISMYHVAGQLGQSAVTHSALPRLWYKTDCTPYPILSLDHYNAHVFPGILCSTLDRLKVDCQTVHRKGRSGGGISWCENLEWDTGQTYEAELHRFADQYLTILSSWTSIDDSTLHHILAQLHITAAVGCSTGPIRPTIASDLHHTSQHYDQNLCHALQYGLTLAYIHTCVILTYASCWWM